MADAINLTSLTANCTITGLSSTDILITQYGPSDIATLYIQFALNTFNSAIILTVLVWWLTIASFARRNDSSVWRSNRFMFFYGTLTLISMLLALLTRFAMYTLRFNFVGPGKSYCVYFQALHNGEGDPNYTLALQHAICLSIADLLLYTGLMFSILFFQHGQNIAILKVYQRPKIHVHGYIPFPAYRKLGFLWVFVTYSALNEIRRRFRGLQGGRTNAVFQKSQLMRAIRMLCGIFGFFWLIVPIYVVNFTIFSAPSWLNLMQINLGLMTLCTNMTSKNKKLSVREQATIGMDLIQLSPEIIRNILACLMTTADLTKVTATCRTLRSHFTADTVSTCLITQFGLKHVFGDSRTYSYFKGSDSLLRLLIKKGANIRAKNDMLLISAAGSGFTDLVRMVLELGTNVKARHNAALGNAVFGVFIVHKR
ncbi:hypothetical protein HK102_013900 [Quaeritorhiza haematococci]|nr:hypothetical protein HK102_013900 [Quaeritorhiza haematococci]